MSTYRPRIIASLCLLLAVGATVVCFTLLRPDPAGAAGTRQRQFVFGPVARDSTVSVSFIYHNTGTRPTPPATVEFRDAMEGTVFGSSQIPSVAPGKGANASGQGPDISAVVVIVRFDAPAAGQAIPNPFPGSIVFFLRDQEVVGPAH
jgi:hypothetical protein